MALINRWEKRIKKIDYAFQGIINPYSGTLFAVEALIRNVEEAGYHNIDEFFHAAYRDKVFVEVERVLRRKVIEKFVQIPFYKKLRLFYNYDPRIHFMDDYKFGFTEKLLAEFGLPNHIFCYELSEKFKYEVNDYTKKFLQLTKKSGFPIALDDFGVGFSGLELFYNTEPDIIKFDRFLIKGIDQDHKKRIFCSHLISLAKVCGITVIAEGVETRGELQTCTELGFDLAQGYFLHQPTTEINGIPFSAIAYKAQAGSLQNQDFERKENTI